MSLYRHFLHVDHGEAESNGLLASEVHDDHLMTSVLNSRGTTIALSFHQLSTLSCPRNSAHRAGNRNKIGSGKYRPHRDIVTRRVRVRTRRVRLPDEHIGRGAGKSWEANPEFGLDPESLRCRAHTDAGLDLRILGERIALANCHEPHHIWHAAGIAGRNQFAQPGQFR